MRIAQVADSSRDELETGISETGSGFTEKSSRLNTILVPVDFSPASLPALSMAVPLAQANQAGVLLLHVIDAALNFPLTGPVNIAKLGDQLREEARRKLLTIAGSFAMQGVRIHCLVAQGRPGEQIARIAEMCRVSLIITGAGRTSRWSRIFHKHTVEDLLKRARCPVVCCNQFVPTAPLVTANGGPGWRPVDPGPESGRASQA